MGNEPDEAPLSIQHLHDLTEKPLGWIELIKSLVRTVPVEHSMGASVITLLMDDSPLPSKDAVMEVADMINKTVRRSVRRERNLCVILGCLAEKLAGPSSIAVLSEATLSYLLGNLVSNSSVRNYFCKQSLIISSFSMNHKTKVYTYI